MGDTENSIIKNLLSSIYYNPSKPGSYGGALNLYREAVKLNPSLTLNDVKDWLQGELVYTLHRKARRKFKRNRVVAEHINENFQADLIDMIEYEKMNDGYKYILTVIDVFSKTAYALPLKLKTANKVAVGMEEVLKNAVPFKLQTDQGLEFKNTIFNKLMKNYEINHFFTKNKEIKCSVVERFNQTLIKKIMKHFTKTGKKRYIDVLQNLVNTYNNTHHSAIKMSPNEVTEFNEKRVFKNLFGFTSKREMLRSYKSPKLNVGDKVRRKYVIGPLERGYYPNWTDKIFTVEKAVKNFNKPLYIIKDSSGEVINQRFYPEEIQKIKDTNIYRVDEILSEKTVRGKKYYKVSWLNHPSTENSWVSADDLFRIEDG